MEFKFWTNAEGTLLIGRDETSGFEVAVELPPFDGDPNDLENFRSAMHRAVDELMGPYATA